MKEQKKNMFFLLETDFFLTQVDDDETEEINKGNHHQMRKEGQTITKQ